MTGKLAKWRKALWRKGRPQWQRLAMLAVGVSATGLAMVLAFHVGQDVARALAGDDDAPLALPTAMAEAAPARASAPTKAPAPAKAPAADTPFVVKSVLKIDGPIRFGQFYWDESQGQPGPVVITVDLTARVLSVFRDGHEIGATAILKGYGDKPTPLGVFPITQKDATHVSNLYDAPMPWMLRLTNDGVSIHGSKVEKGYATNGCVGVPDEFAKRLFKVASLGDKVIITDGKRLDVGGSINPGA